MFFKYDPAWLTFLTAPQHGSCLIRAKSLASVTKDAAGFTVDYSLKEHPQPLRIACVGYGLLLGNLPREHQLLQGLIKTLHALG